MRLEFVTVLIVALLASPLGTAAQVPTLDRVDSLVIAGEYDSARSILDQWWSARDEFDVPGSDKARALMLRARLAGSPEAAEPDYLAIVLGYPTSPYAPDALLRLGQGLLAAGDAARAAAYLERLVADYPGRPQRTRALLWLARANTAARRPGAACSAAQEGLRSTNDPDLRSMLQVEAGASCAVRTQPRSDDRPDDPPVAASGSFAVQAGAFQYRRSADNLVERLRQAGFQPRIVRLPGSELLRVRVGRFDGRGGADRLVTRLRDQGFDAVVVTDADDERET